jgi:hypothetical protein
MTRHPFMPIAHPSPISSQPHVAGLGSDTDDFLARRRRRDHDHAIGVMSLIGHDDAGAKRHGECAERNVTKYVGTHVGNLLFLDRGAKNSAEL